MCSANSLFVMREHIQYNYLIVFLDVCIPFVYHAFTTVTEYFSPSLFLPWSTTQIGQHHRNSNWCKIQWDTWLTPNLFVNVSVPGAESGFCQQDGWSLWESKCNTGAERSGNPVMNKHLSGRGSTCSGPLLSDLSVPVLTLLLSL